MPEKLNKKYGIVYIHRYIYVYCNILLFVIYSLQKINALEYFVAFTLLYETQMRVHFHGKPLMNIGKTKNEMKKYVH